MNMKNANFSRKAINVIVLLYSVPLFLYRGRFYNNPQDYIPCDDDGKRRDAEDGDQWDARNEEDIFHFVSFPSPLFEFQCEHRNLGNQKPGADEDTNQDKAARP